MRTAYECLECAHTFSIEVTEVEQASSLAPDRTDGCPRCGRWVGEGPTDCVRCGAMFTVSRPHWHVRCTVSDAQRCPGCGLEHRATCVC